MNGNTQRVVWWIMGALIAITLGLSSALFGMIQKDIEDIRDRQDTLDERMTQIQQQYYKIDVIQYQLEQLLNEE